MKDRSDKRLRILERVTLSLAVVLFLQAGSMRAQGRVEQDSRLGAVAPAAGLNLKSSFSYSPYYPKAGQIVQFNDTSAGAPNSWQWDFGDGTVSNLQNPSHSFDAPGFYRVSLNVSGGSGTKSVRRTVIVTNFSAHTASFVFQPAFPAAGQSVQFTDTSTGDPTSWLWDFGDGLTSAAQSPSHIYQKRGFYKVILTTTKGSAAKSVRRTVTVMSGSAIAAAFTYSPASPAAGQSVQFTDTSVGSPTSWSWNFGDGSTSTVQSPSHTYTTAGSKTVTLTATNGSGSNATSRTVTVGAALVASFNFSPASPAAGQVVQFTDTSVGTPTSWSGTLGTDRPRPPRARATPSRRPDRRP